MPPLKDETEIEDMDSSTVSQTDAPADDTNEKVNDGDEANSSNATGETDVDLLSVVRNVQTKRQEKAPDAASQAAGEEDGSKPGDQPRKQDDENFSDVPFNKHPRFRQLLQQRNEFKHDAQQYRNVQNFLDDNGLAPDEAADGLQIMALAKSDPVKAWERIKPWVQKLLVAAGEVLPDDLSQRVQAGELTAEAAMEVSRSRAATSTVQVQRTLDEQRRERAANRDRQTAIMNAAAAWEDDRAAKDPNFDAKRPALTREILYLQKVEGVPTTAEDTRKQLARAYEAVNAAFVPPRRRTSPSAVRRPAVSPVTSEGHVAGKQRSEAKTTMDIVKNVVAKHRGQ